MSNKLLNMTLCDIAAEATAKIRSRIDTELPGDMEATMPWRVNDIIRDVVEQYLPKKALPTTQLRCCPSSGRKEPARVNGILFSKSLYWLQPEIRSEPSWTSQTCLREVLSLGRSATGTLLRC